MTMPWFDVKYAANFSKKEQAMTAESWDIEVAKHEVTRAVETAAAHHRPGHFDALAFRTFDERLAQAFEDEDLGAVRKLCEDYRIKVTSEEKK
jgi:hypothetical protein